MPELPEVETVRSGLEQAINGAQIKTVLLRRKNLRVPFPVGFAGALEGRVIQSIGRRAKYLLLYLDSGEVVIAHLGMSGRFTVLPKKPTSFNKHDHFVAGLADGRYLIFNDARRFGLMTLTPQSKLNQHKLLRHLGPEPLSEDFSAEYLARVLKTRKIAIKPALMDQELVVGVGNIYASEALFDAGIDPRKPASQAAKDAEKIVLAIRKVLKAALASGGSSLRDFIDITGGSGYFQHEFKVYDREGKSCHACGSNIQAIRQAGRSSFFCPACQK